MGVEVFPVIGPEAQTSATPDHPADFEERWAAWQARGAAHERAVRRRTAVAAAVVMVLIVLAAGVLYALAGR